MPGRILVVANDDLEWQAFSRELGSRFELLRANGRIQALALLDREAELCAAVAYWGALSSGPELMRAISTRRATLPRVLVSDRAESGEAQALIVEAVVHAVVANPSAVAAALETPAPARQHPLRAEARTPVKVQLPVSTSAWQGFVPLFTKDASRGGVFFFFAQRVMPTSGTACLVKLGAAEVAGTVRHVMTARLATATGTDAGFGVSFTEPQAADWWVPLLAPAAGAPPPPSGAAKTPTPKELESARNFHALGLTLYQQRNYAVARQKFELAARCAPDPKHEAMQACCHAAQHAHNGHHDKAREAFNRALQLDPGCAPASIGLSHLKR